MDLIKQQEQKVLELRKRWVEGSPAMKACIAVLGRVEKDKLEKMREKAQESAENPRLL